MVSILLLAIFVRFKLFFFQNIHFVEMDSSSSNILKWILKQVDGDEIEEVTDEMLDKLVSGELDGKGSIFCKYFFLH